MTSALVLLAERATTPMNTTLAALGVFLWIILPVCIVFSAAFSILRRDFSMDTITVRLVISAALCWIPLVLRIFLRIGDGNPTINILYGAASTVVSVTLWLVARSFKSKEQSW